MARFRFVKPCMDLIQEEPSTRADKRKALMPYARDFGAEVLKFFAEKVVFRGYPVKGEALIDIVAITAEEGSTILRLIDDPDKRKMAQKIMDPYNTYGG